MTLNRVRELMRIFSVQQRLKKSTSTLILADVGDDVDVSTMSALIQACAMFPSEYDYIDGALVLKIYYNNDEVPSFVSENTPDFDETCKLIHKLVEIYTGLENFKEECKGILEMAKLRARIYQVVAEQWCTEDMDKWKYKATDIRCIGSSEDKGFLMCFYKFHSTIHNQEGDLLWEHDQVVTGTHHEKTGYRIQMVVVD